MRQHLQRAILAVLLGLALAFGVSPALGGVAEPATVACNPGTCGGGG
jgi:hypothetical protein